MLSYNHLSKDVVGMVRDQLEKEKYPVWIDEYYIDRGTITTNNFGACQNKYTWRNDFQLSCLEKEAQCTCIIAKISFNKKLTPHVDYQLYHHD